jgi:hypothetical protein
VTTWADGMRKRACSAMSTGLRENVHCAPLRPSSLRPQHAADGHSVLGPWAHGLRIHLLGQGREAAVVHCAAESVWRNTGRHARGHPSECILRHVSSRRLSIARPLVPRRLAHMPWRWTNASDSPPPTVHSHHWKLTRPLLSGWGGRTPKKSLYTSNLSPISASLVKSIFPVLLWRGWGSWPWLVRPQRTPRPFCVDLTQ